MSGDGTVSGFRRRRGRLLSARIAMLAAEKGAGLSILDIGGRRDYWDNVDLAGVASVVIVNADAADLGRPSGRSEIFEDRKGDARALPEFANGAFDLYHSNSVIEHVGGWAEMAAMAREARRVGRHGWVQTPAWEFPVEPHFRLPFMHWLATPARAALLPPARDYRGLDLDARRRHAERINLLSRDELRHLFPGTTLHVERVILAKSYVVLW